MSHTTPLSETLQATSLQPQLSISLPARLVFDPKLPSAALSTWARLRSLAAKRDETPPLTMRQLCQVSGRTRSTVYRHLAALKEHGALSWHAEGFERIIVSFPECDGDDLGTDSQTRECKSQNQDSNSHFCEINSQNRENDSHFRENDSQKCEKNAHEHPISTAESQKWEKNSQNCDSASLKPSLINQESLKIKERGRKFSKTRKDAPENGTPTAAKLYRQLARISPNPAQRDLLGGNVIDLGRWEAALKHWLAHGWNPRNLQGMLELYERGGPPGCKYCERSNPLERAHAIIDSLFEGHQDGTAEPDPEFN